MKQKLRTLLLTMTFMLLQAITVMAAGNSMADATAITMGRNYSGSITETNYSDYYKFTLTQSGRVNFTANTDMYAVNYYLYNEDGDEIFYHYNEKNSTTGENNFVKDYDLCAGTYYFAVKDSKSRTGNYSFKLSFTSANESFPESFSVRNDAMNQANTISLEKSYNGQLSFGDYSDYYKFTLSKSGKVNFTANTDMYAVNYYLYNEDGDKVFYHYNEKNSTTGKNSLETSSDLCAGTYYFAVKDSKSRTGNYSFKLSFTSANESFPESFSVRNDAMNQANTISLEKSYNGQLSFGDYSDYYKFTLSKSAKVNFTANTDMYAVNYYLYNEDGDKVFYHYNEKNSTTGKNNLAEDYDLSAGTYYFAVKDSKSRTGNYTFKLHVHTYKNEVTKATTKKNGSIVKKCSCGAVKSTTTIYRPDKCKLSSKIYEYNNRKRTPSVTIKDTAGKTISSSNYTVEYPSGRKNIGTYKVKIVFKGNYSGVLYTKFDIVPKSTSIAKLSPKSKGFNVTWKKQTSQVSGYEIQYSTSKKFAKSQTKTKTISGAKNKNIKISGLKAKKNYYVRIRTYKKVSGKKYYSSWSKAKLVKTK